jgi:predicted nucleic acid-binding protein
MQSTILIDAGPLIALFDRDDNYHKRVVDFIKGSSWQFVTTTAVLTEVSYMLNFNVNAQLDFFEWIVLNGVTLFELEQYDMARVIYLIKKYQDLPIDFADATLVIAAESTGIRTIISIDSDFDIYRLPGKILIKNIFTG